MVAYTPYIRDILRGHTKPHPYSWFVWAANSSLIFVAQITHGGGAGSFTTATVAIASLIVFLLSLRQGGAQYRAGDVAFLVLAIVAGALWLVAGQPVLSVVLLVASDVLAVVPSARKAWSAPDAETASQWIVNAVRHALTIGALQNYNVVTALNPFAWVICDALFAALILIRRRTTDRGRSIRSQRRTRDVTIRFLD